MFSRIAVVVALAATAVMARPQIVSPPVTAQPLTLDADALLQAGPVSSCNSGDLQCCNQVQSVREPYFIYTLHNVDAIS